MKRGPEDLADKTGEMNKKREEPGGNQEGLKGPGQDGESSMATCNRNEMEAGPDGLGEQDGRYQGLDG